MARRSCLQHCPCAGLVLRRFAWSCGIIYIYIYVYIYLSQESSASRRTRSRLNVRLQLCHPLLARLDVFPQAHLLSIRFPEMRLDDLHLASLRLLPMRVRLVAGLHFIGEILHLMAQDLNLAILRVTSCFKVVALACGQVKLIPRSASKVRSRP